MNIDSDQRDFDETDRNLVLLFHANELPPENQNQAEQLLQSSKAAREYLDELDEIQSLAGEIVSEIDCAMPWVGQAILSEKASLQDGADTQTTATTTVGKTEVGTKKKSSRAHSRDNRYSIFYVAASVALLMTAISVFRIASPDTVIPAQANLADSRANPTEPLKTQKKTVADSVPVAPPKKRKKIRIKSDLLAKIQNTRSKMKSFKKRLEKRS